MFSRLYIVTVLLCLVACDNAPVRPGESHKDTSLTSTGVASPTPVDTTTGLITGLQVEPAIRKADSLQVLYFDDPDGDSLRYTRFYKYITSSDPVLRDLILSNLDQSFVKVPSVRNCRSEGKIFMYAGENPVKTLYFSTRTDTCSYLYMISTGEFLYFNLNDSLRNELRSSKKMAKAP